MQAGMFQGFGWDFLGIIWEASACFLGNFLIRGHLLCMR